MENTVASFNLVAAFRRCTCLVTFFAALTSTAQTVRIGSADTELQTLLIPPSSRISPKIQLSAPYDLDMTEHDGRRINHGTLSYLTIFRGLGPEYQLVSLASVGHYPTLEDTGAPYLMSGTQVFQKQDGGKRFFEVHTRAQAQVIYVGWPLNAGSAIIEEQYLRKMVDAGVILVEVAPALDESRGLVIGGDDKYSLLVGAVDSRGLVALGSRTQGVDIFCPDSIDLPGGVTFSETSAATAICTRYVAQLKAVDPNLKIEDIRNLLTRSGDPAPPGATAKIANIDRAISLLRTLKNKKD